ncbi:SLATT domain-containing protein [Marinobacterium aestuariivivens]|uniref:SLATT domain-containing protein n=1 Tax=Marinobacterium aestuariivivens TaxID=1698799 RepID=A0ABW2A144_9GAMM
MAFSDNVWWTRKARIQSEKRLLSNAFQAQALLLWYSFFSVSSAVYYLNLGETTSNPEFSGIAWVVFSVLVLCISGFINGLSFKERASLIKECYETLSGLYHKSKHSNADFAKLSSEYDQILGVCENHTDRDYYLALCIEHVTKHGKVDATTGFKNGLDRCPTWYHWLFLAYWYVRRWLMLIFLYLLPILIFTVLEYPSDR